MSGLNLCRIEPCHRGRSFYCDKAALRSPEAVPIALRMSGVYNDSLFEAASF